MAPQALIRKASCRASCLACCVWCVCVCSGVLLFVLLYQCGWCYGFSPLCLCGTGGCVCVTLGSCACCVVLRYVLLFAGTLCSAPSGVLQCCFPALLSCSLCVGEPTPLHMQGGTKLSGCEVAHWHCLGMLCVDPVCVVCFLERGTHLKP